MSKLPRGWSPPEYTIGAGDVLDITLIGLDTPTAATLVPARVDKSGKINLPFIGEISVLGMELDDAEKSIVKRYTGDDGGESFVRSMSVNIELSSVETTDVMVLGPVAAPGLTALRSSERNLMHALSRAGGFNPEASGRVALKRMREPNDVAVYDLTTPDGLSEALSSSPLEDGDILAMEATQPNTIFIGGLVERPLPQRYPNGVKMTVLQALAAAGGLRQDMAIREGTLVRRLDGDDVHVRLDFDRIRGGEDPNFELAAGDILWVPHTAGTRIQEFINRNIFLRAGVSVNYNVSGIEFLNRHNLQSSGAGGGSIEDSFDPFGSLLRNQALQGLGAP
jgi:polysaccharide export outer membrane protein